MSISRKSKLDWETIDIKKCLVGIDLLSGDRFIGTAIDWNSSYVKLESIDCSRTVSLAKKHIVRILMLIKEDLKEL